MERKVIKLGNVFADSKLLKVADHLILSNDFAVIDRSLPTLIIGLDNARKYIDGFRIKKKSYSEQNLWWTYKANERRKLFDEDMFMFSKMCLSSITEGVEYEYVNIITLSYSSIKRFIEFINSPKRKYFFIDRNRFIFIYIRERKLFLGLSLSTLMFLGVDKKKVVDKFFKNRYNQWIRDFDVIPQSVRPFLDDDILQRIAVAVYFRSK